jgi:propionyl-CoA synthetase
MSNLKQQHSDSISNPDAYWGAAAEELHWHRKWDKVLDDSDAPFYRWFSGGQINTCFNALDRHVHNGRGDQPALIYDSPVTGTKRVYSYRELTDEVARTADALTSLGVEKGDRVIIYMPMIPEAAITMLACARIGAIHSVVFGGFASNELAVRIDDAKPRVVVSASCGIEPARIVEYKPLLDAALDLSKHTPSACLILQRAALTSSMVEGRDYDFREVVSSAKSQACVPVDATDPLYILYTSGTTGQPKGVVRDNGGHAVALKWSMRAVYDVEPGDVFWAASDVGWVVGHSYIVYGPLLNGNTTVLYEGKPVGTPDAAAFWRVIEEHRVKVLFTAPTAFRAIKREDPAGALIGKHDLSCFKTLYLAGERCDPDTLHWAEDKLGIPVVDHWWQTETGWAICANCRGIEALPVKDGSPTKAAPGWDLRVLDQDGQEVKTGQIGALVAKLPLPPGTFTTLWNDRDRHRNAYLEEFPGYYATADAGLIDEDGYVFVMSRTDDIINVAGHRLSTGAMEEILAAHPDVAECAVTGVAHALKGQIPLGFVVLNSGCDRTHADVVKELVGMIRETIGPVAAFKNALVVDRLPKTRSGKILRSTMRKIADAESWTMPATIDDPSILDEIASALRSIGYAES